MLWWKYIFIISCFIIFYNYIGYALLIYFFNLFRRSKKTNTTNDFNFFPTVSLIVAAYNEEYCIEEKIINSLQQNYPSEKIEYIFITDGSTDKTPEIISGYKQISLLHSNERRGKSAAVNRAVLHSKNDILIFSDANTVLNTEAIKNISRHYINPKTGGVAGEKKVAQADTTAGEVGAGEGMYWKYESTLKKLDSQFYSVVGAAGELFSVRKDLYEPIADNIILDDFVISLKIAQKGYRIIYEPDSYATELPSFSMKDEQKRKIRIAAGGFQAMWILRSLFCFWRYPRLFFLYISHRFLRWAVTPFCLFLAFISNAILFFSVNNYFFKICFILQLCFYVMALAGSFISSKNIIARIFKLAYYFLFMNISVIRGFFRFMKGNQPATWEKAKRQQALN